MMTTTDTSAEFVEALASWHAHGTPWPEGLPRPPMFVSEATASTLCALRAERDAERVAREHWQSQVQSTVQSLLKAEAERDGALGLAKRHMDEKHRTERQAAEDWDVLQQRIKTAESERDRLRAEVAALTEWRDEPPGGISKGGVLYLSPERVAAQVEAARRDEREANAAEVDCGCDIRDAVLARLESQGAKRASYLCSHGDVCCAIQAAAIRARGDA